MSFDIKIAFDNKCVKEGFKPGFGFSAIIYNHFTDNYLLFDTGDNIQTLSHNIKHFGINLKEIKKIIISHNHYDHNGALSHLWRENNNITLYIPDALEEYEQHFPNACIHSFKEFTEIEKNIHVSGQLGTSIKEQALLLKSNKNEWIMLVGCTHPGLEAFIIEARKVLPIGAIIGGFHDFRKYSYLEGISFIGACHCTMNVGSIKERFPDQYRRVCVGDTFSF